MHNQGDRANRFKYLVDTFKTKPLKQEGISDSHMSMIHLLFLLADNPVGPDGFIDENVRGKISNKVYLTQSEAEEQHKHLVEDQIRDLQMALKEERKQQELSEDMEDDVDEFSSDDIDDDEEEGAI